MENSTGSSRQRTTSINQQPSKASSSASALPTSSGITITHDKDGQKLSTVQATAGDSGELRELTYSDMKVIGNGSFGVVFRAKITGAEAVGTDDDVVAIKKVLQDKRFKNRELQIMRLLAHINIVKLKYFFSFEWREEGRRLPESGARVCTRNGLPCVETLQQEETVHSKLLCQAVHVPAVPIARVHPLFGDLPSGHQTTEPPSQSRDGYFEALRLRKCENLGQGRAERILHLFTLLQSPRTHLWGDGLFDCHRRVVSWVCPCRDAPGAATIPGGQWRQSTRRNHSRTGHSFA